MNSNRLILTTAATIAAAALVPAGAGAAVRHADADTGFGLMCSAQQPCTLAQAVNGALAGDEIVVHAGTYTVAGIGSKTKRLSVRGAAGESRPRIDTSRPRGSGSAGLRWAAAAACATCSSTTSRSGMPCA